MCGKPELLLSKGMEQNYHALQNFLNNIEVPKAKKRARKQNKDMRLQHQLVKLRMLKEQNFQCLDCGYRFEEVDGQYPTATADHIIPERFGSCLTMNGEWVCWHCNIIRNKNPLPHILRYFGTIE